MGPQLKALRQGAQIIVATPGRLVDHLSRNDQLLSTIGFLVLDEPEAGLSFVSQARLANRLTRLPEDGVQVLLATHSPILAAIPGAQLIELDETGLHARRWEDLLTVALYRRFLADPGYFGLGPDA